MAVNKREVEAAMEKDFEMVRIFLLEGCTQMEAYARSRGKKKATDTDRAQAPTRFKLKHTKDYLDKLRGKIEAKAIEKASDDLAWTRDMATSQLKYVIGVAVQDIKENQALYEQYKKDKQQEDIEDAAYLVKEEARIRTEIKERIANKKLTKEEAGVQLEQALQNLARKKKIDLKSYRAKTVISLVTQKAIQEAVAELNDIHGISKPDEMVFAPRVIITGEDEFKVEKE